MTISSRYPIWSTNPAGFKVAGWWPVLTGSLAVLLIPPLLGLFLAMISLALNNSADAGTYGNITVLDTLIITLIGSPLVSWMILIFVIPISGFVSGKGRAGWGVACAAGAVSGGIIAVLFNGNFPQPSELAVVCGVGVCFALLYWFAIRVMHPTAMGVAFRKA